MTLTKTNFDPDFVLISTCRDPTFQVMMTPVRVSIVCEKCGCSCLVLDTKFEL